METANILKTFFTDIAHDGRIGPTHIAVFTALLQYWQQHGEPVPLRVYSYQVMDMAKLSSSKTYYRALKDLDAYGYLHYEPSFKKNQPSRIYWKSAAWPEARRA